MFVNFEQNRSN